jgi:hypothetical protein
MIVAFEYYLLFHSERKPMLNLGFTISCIVVVCSSLCDYDSTLYIWRELMGISAAKPRFVVFWHGGIAYRRTPVMSFP